MKKNKNIIRDNDVVRIINPEFIVHVGYDFDFQSCVKEIEERVKGDFSSNFETMLFCSDVIVAHAIVDNFDANILTIRIDNASSDIGKKMIRAMAYDLLCSRMKTGAERKIVTETFEDYRGCEATVYGSRIVNTGKYFPPSGGGYCSYDYDSYDYEPGGLSDRKTHKLICLPICEMRDPRCNQKFYAYGGWIEVCNVEKIHIEEIK